MRKVAIVGLVGAALTGAGCRDSARPTAPTEFEIPVYGVAPHSVRQFIAQPLNSRQEVPPVAVKTRAVGRARFVLQKDGTLAYKLVVKDIRKVTQAHIHLGERGVAGPIVVWLFPSVRARTPLPPDRAVTIVGETVLRRGVIREQHVLPADDPAFPGTIAALVRRFRNRAAYVNVHTVQNPPGEIRGQVWPEPQ